MSGIKWLPQVNSSSEPMFDFLETQVVLCAAFSHSSLLFHLSRCNCFDVKLCLINIIYITKILSKRNNKTWQFLGCAPFPFIGALSIAVEMKNIHCFVRKTSDRVGRVLTDSSCCHMQFFPWWDCFFLFYFHCALNMISDYKYVLLRSFP